MIVVATYPEILVCCTFQIDRIQNPVLYRQFMNRKLDMDRTNPGQENEKRLWHGTSGANVININNRNFNRSYCGQHGKANLMLKSTAIHGNSTFTEPFQVSYNLLVYVCMHEKYVNLSHANCKCVVGKCFITNQLKGMMVALIEVQQHDSLYYEAVQCVNVVFVI